MDGPKQEIKTLSVFLKKNTKLLPSISKSRVVITLFFYDWNLLLDNSYFFNLTDHAVLNNLINVEQKGLSQD